MSKTENQLEGESALWETRAKCCGWSVIAGLVLEVILTWAFPAHEPKETNWYLAFIEIFGPVFADGLVAAGVWGEIFCSGKVRKIEGELRRISNDKVAAAKTRAAEAQEQLRKFRVPRHTLMDAHGIMQRMTEKLRSFAPLQFDTGLAAGPAEPMHFLWRLEKVLRDAGWRHLDWIGGVTTGQGSKQSGREWRNGFVWADDVEIHIRPGGEPMFATAAAALIGALNEIDIAAKVIEFNIHNENTETLHILIGLKQ